MAPTPGAAPTAAAPVAESVPAAPEQKVGLRDMGGLGRVSLDVLMFKLSLSHQRLFARLK